MKIISKRKDYYDTCMKHGTDNELVYNRKHSDIVVNLNEFQNSKNEHFEIIATLMHRLHHCESGFSFPSIVGFCGKIYFEVYYKNGNDNHLIASDNFDDFINQINNISPDINFLNIKNNIFYKERLMRLFNEVMKSDYFQNVFIENKVPVFSMYHESRWNQITIVLNPILVDYEFQKVIDPYTAYQEISMFLGGVIGKSNCYEQNIDDESMKHKKGFDDMSFKKLPTKKRK